MCMHPWETQHTCCGKLSVKGEKMERRGREAKRGENGRRQDLTAPLLWFFVSLHLPTSHRPPPPLTFTLEHSATFSAWGLNILCAWIFANASEARKQGHSPTLTPRPSGWPYEILGKPSVTLVSSRYRGCSYLSWTEHTDSANVEDMLEELEGQGKELWLWTSKPGSCKDAVSTVCSVCTLYCPKLCVCV